MIRSEEGQLLKCTEVRLPGGGGGGGGYSDIFIHT